MDKLSTICFKQHHYSVPDYLVGKTVELCIFTDEIVIKYGVRDVAKHKRSFVQHGYTLEMLHYRETLLKKPGALHSSLCLEQASDALKQLYDRYFIDRPREFVLVLNLLHEHSLHKLSEVVEQLKNTGVPLQIDYIKLMLEQRNTFYSSETQSDIEVACEAQLAAYTGMGSMSNEAIKGYAKQLRLNFIASNIDEELQKCTTLNSSPNELLQSLLLNEVNSRSDRSKQARIKAAGFPYKKYLDELDMSRVPTEAVKRIPELETLDFITKGQNIVEYGNPGTGKTHLAIGIGLSAATAGFSVKYYSVPTLINRLKELKNQKNLTSIQKQFEKTDLMILDELGYISFDKEGGVGLTDFLHTYLCVQNAKVLSLLLI